MGSEEGEDRDKPLNSVDLYPHVVTSLWQDGCHHCSRTRTTFKGGKRQGRREEPCLSLIFYQESHPIILVPWQTQKAGDRMFIVDSDHNWDWTHCYWNKITVLSAWKNVGEQQTVSGPSAYCVWDCIILGAMRDGRTKKWCFLLNFAEIMYFSKYSLLRTSLQNGALLSHWLFGCSNTSTEGDDLSHVTFASNCKDHFWRVVSRGAWVAQSLGHLTSARVTIS